MTGLLWTALQAMACGIWITWAGFVTRWIIARDDERTGRATRGLGDNVRLQRRVLDRRRRRRRKK